MRDAAPQPDCLQTGPCVYTVTPKERLRGREKRFTPRARLRKCPDAGCCIMTELERFALDYLPVALFLAIALILSLLFILGAAVLAPSEPDPEKNSAYESGFKAFDDARTRFDVRFYLVAILFIIFDLEVAFLFPWAVSLGEIGLFGFWSMVGFLGVLTVGFIYEWKKGALEWD